MLLSMDIISVPIALYCRANISRMPRTAGDTRLSALSPMILSNSAVPLGPFVDTMPSSAKCPRRALLNIVRWRTSNCRVRCGIKAVCCSADARLTERRAIGLMSFMGQGESYAPESYTDRTLASGALDFHIGHRTAIKTNFSHYQTDVTGLPGSIVYFGKPNIVLPNPLIPPGLATGNRERARTSSPIRVSSRASMNSTTTGISRLAAFIRLPCAICSALPIC
jgi:hypothetical protein